MQSRTIVLTGRGVTLSDAVPAARKGGRVEHALSAGQFAIGGGHR